MNRRTSIATAYLFFFSTFVLSTLIPASTALADDPKSILLWPDGAPGAKGDKGQDKPTLILYPAANNPSGTAVVVCPGGGYGGLAMGHEGHDIAKWLNDNGISAFICNYRHRGKGYSHPYPLMDAQRAIRLVRAHSVKWKINPGKVGIIGFSAGGHLASSTATHDSIGELDQDDATNKLNCRPSFAILCYAVIGFEKPYTHKGSQRNLIGTDADEKLVNFYSNEEQVSKATCPTFLWHTAEDKAVPPENSVQFFLSCQKHGVPSALHVFEKGRHGIGLAKNNPTAKHWPQLCIDWIKQRGFLK